MLRNIRSRKSYLWVSIWMEPSLSKRSDWIVIALAVEVLIIFSSSRLKAEVRTWKTLFVEILLDFFMANSLSDGSSSIFFFYICMYSFDKNSFIKLKYGFNLLN